MKNNKFQSTCTVNLNFILKVENNEMFFEENNLYIQLCNTNFKSYLWVFEVSVVEMKRRRRIKLLATRNNNAIEVQRLKLNVQMWCENKIQNT